MAKDSCLKKHLKTVSTKLAYFKAKHFGCGVPYKEMNEEDKATIDAINENDKRLEENGVKFDMM